MGEGGSWRGIGDHAQFVRSRFELGDENAFVLEAPGAINQRCRSLRAHKTADLRARSGLAYAGRGPPMDEHYVGSALVPGLAHAGLNDASDLFHNVPVDHRIVALAEMQIDLVGPGKCEL